MSNNDFSNLNKENNELIISYAFSPTNTTTSNVMAKRILKNKENVDVICSSLDNLPKDYEIDNLLNEFILNKIIVDLPFSVDWSNIKLFIEKGMENLNNKKYEKIYSRCYFQHSHFLGFEYKIANKDTFWSAEFSDPTIYNIKGDENTAPINDKEYIGRINSYLGDDLPKITINDSLNFICEYLTYVFADEIIFTNENQKEVMLNLFPHKEIRDIVSKKAKISPHPTLDEKYYYIKENNYEIDKKYVNFAYFGAIYGNRTLEDFINAFDNIDPIFTDKFRLHIFTDNITMFEQLLSENTFKKTRLNSSIPYLDFLNLSTEFDCLIVNDSLTKGIYNKNPYLPSKISDYIGSETDIWGICEENSIMYNMNIKYKSLINDMISNQNILTNILLEKTGLNVKDLKNINELDILNRNTKYLQGRIMELSVKINELIQVAENEFEKNDENSNYINKLKKENNNIKNSNVYKYSEKFKKIGKKFK